jgi:hypothetical protein
MCQLSSHVIAGKGVHGVSSVCTEPGKGVRGASTVCLLANIIFASLKSFHLQYRFSEVFAVMLQPSFGFHQTHMPCEKTF